MHAELMFTELQHLAAERSPEKRLGLLRKITDLFFAGIDTHTESETSLFNEVIDHIVDQISHDARIDVATNLATLPGFPLPVVRRLAHDGDIEVARPVIRGAIGLTDLDLIDIGRKASDQHLDAIAGRTLLSEAVTDVLIDRGSPDVMRTVSANHGAAFSEWGMDTLVGKARDDGSLQRILVERSDLTQTAVDKLSSIVSEALAVKLAERGYQVSGQIPEKIVKTAREAFERAVQDRDRGAQAAERVIAQFVAGRITLENALLEIIKSQQMLAVATLLSHHTGLDRNVLMKILSGGTRQTVMVLLRALDLQWQTVAAFMAFRATRQRTPSPPDVNAQRDFESMDAAAAKRTLHFLQIRARGGTEAVDDANPAVA